MGSDGREPSKLDPLLDEIAKEAHHEPPMAADDATGHVPKERYQRHLAVEAWRVVREHDANVPLPTWVLDYLKSVARRIDEETGPKGALSREGASIALGIDGKAWSEHAPVSVYQVMQRWIDDDDMPEITGPKTAASEYIQEKMHGDREAKVDTVLRKYKEGKRLWLSEV